MQAFLDPLSVRALPGVGPATGKRLQRLKIETVADLRARSREELEAVAGRFGGALYSYSRGRDERPVRVHRERKSLSSETTYGSDLETLDEMDVEVGRLARQVSKGLRKRSMSACTLTLKVRYEDFTTVTRSQTLAAPTSEASVIESTSRALLRRSAARTRRVRLLGVGASNLIAGGIEQLLLFADPVA